MYFSQILKWFHAPERRGDQMLAGSICGEKEFLRTLARERARAERSSHRFSLIVFQIVTVGKNNNGLYHLLRELSSRLRLTDETGWLPMHRVGIILHNADAPNARKFANSIQATLLLHEVQLSFRVFSYPAQDEAGAGSGKWPDRRHGMAGDRQQFSRKGSVDDLQLFLAHKPPLFKRGLDLLGSTLCLVLLSPVFALLWVLIKAVSPGPAFYRQTRIGLGGRPFTLWKFRTMEVDVDTSGHRDYLASLINGDGEGKGCDRAMAKLDDHDCHIIPLGKWIRKSYLDELPQLFNVLRGEMSLIGPRPPIPYEVAEYKLWHNDRFDTVPGMTGLWQVSGKNRLSFEQMVRLDIRYCRGQSFWLDIKILLLTPVVIVSEFSGSLDRIKRYFRNDTDTVRNRTAKGLSGHPIPRRGG